MIWVMVLGAVAGGLLLVAAFSRGGGKDGARKEVRREPRREPRSPPSGRESSSASVAATVSILDANVGDRVRLVGAGEHGETIEFDVDRRNRYELDALEWFEVRGRYKGGYVFVEYSDEDDHGLEITANLDSVTYELSDLGIDEEVLIAMDEEQSGSRGFEFGGTRWSYVWSGEISYFKAGRGDREGYYCWDFRASDGGRELCIEKWEDEPFEAAIARVLDPDSVEVVRA